MRSVLLLAALLVGCKVGDRALNACTAFCEENGLRFSSAMQSRTGTMLSDDRCTLPEGGYVCHCRKSDAQDALAERFGELTGDPDMSIADALALECSPEGQDGKRVCYRIHDGRPVFSEETDEGSDDAQR